MRRKSEQEWLWAAAFTAGFILVLAIAIAPVDDIFTVVIVITIFSGGAILHRMFSSSRFFAVSFANFLALYTCLFVFFVEGNFKQISNWIVSFGYITPIVTFMVAVLWRRELIREIVDKRHEKEAEHFAEAHFWLLPLIVIGALTFFIPKVGMEQWMYDTIFLGSMLVIGIIVFVLSRPVCTFLLGTGLLFEDFFVRFSQLIQPVFAFFTFYTLIIIVFACIYRIIDIYTKSLHFIINGKPQVISFTESLYFSVVTLSTVGYGDITPQSDVIRIIVAIQVIFGVLLLIFGFAEIMRYTREKKH